MNTYLRQYAKFNFIGAIIPLKTMESVTNYNPDPIIFAIFPGGTEGIMNYYEDDGSTVDYLVCYSPFIYIYHPYNLVSITNPLQNSKERIALHQSAILNKIQHTRLC